MRQGWLQCAVAAGLLLSASAWAQSPAPTGAAATPVVQLGAATFEPHILVQNMPLQLNGAGVRYKAVFRVYAAGLYTAAPVHTLEAALAAPGPKRVRIVMLREIGAAELGKGFTRGMEDNAPREEFSKSIPGTLALSDLFFRMKKLKAGESFSVDWVPGTGTLITVNGKVEAGPIKEPEFFTALLRIWLGNKPADAALKDALLGQANPG